MRTPDTAGLNEVYAVPIQAQWLLFAPRTGTSAIVNRAAVAAVAACASGDGQQAPPQVQALWAQLADNVAPVQPPPATPEKLVIIPTRGCNMRCVYCDFGAAAAHRPTLDPRLACRLIDDVIARRLPASPAMLRIHFFGGEPLVARPCVEMIVHYARMACARAGLIPWFEVTTNGLFDDSAVPFIGDYVDSVVISLDGDDVRHDFNRRRANGGGTYAAIAENIRRLARYPVEVSLRACITNRSVDAMAAIARHFCAAFQFDVLGFEMLAPNASAGAAGLTPPDPGRFAAGVLQAEAVAAAHDVRIVHGPSELAGPRGTSCPVGRGTLMLTPEGLLTACYLEIERWTSRGIDPVIGRVDAAGGIRIEQQKLDAIDALVADKPRCARCFCRHSCAGGCHIEQTPPGCALAYDDRCRAIRAITAGRLLANLDGRGAALAFAGSASALRGVGDHADDRLAAWLPARPPSPGGGP